MLDADARRALESMMRATEDDSMPIIRRLARIQARHVLNASGGGDAIPAVEACTCQRFPTHQANDCPAHGLEPPFDGVPHATPKPPAGGDAGADAADILDHYAQFIRDEVKADDLERHPYLPHIEQVAADLRAALALPAPVVEGERWRHVKRGTVYEVIGYAELQNGNAKGLREGAELAVYRGEDGKLWARERGEFHDGRFAALSEGRSHG